MECVQQTFKFIFSAASFIMSFNVSSSANTVFPNYYNSKSILTIRSSNNL